MGNLLKCPSEADKNRPWLDATGRPLPLSSIQEISKKWPTETWEAYLQTLEGSQSEYLPSHDSSIAAPISLEPDSRDGSDTGPSTVVVKVAMAELPSLERAVIESLLLDRISERGAADLYGVTRWKIRTLKQHALTNLQGRIDIRSLPS